MNGTFWLAYRIRRPLGSGRGVGVVVARSLDGVDFKPVCEVRREAFGAASLERPVILPTDFGWRLYLSCATPNPSTGGLMHWTRSGRRRCHSVIVIWCSLAMIIGRSRIR